MKRLTVHIKNVKKESVDGKSKIYNTIALMVRDEHEGVQALTQVEESFENGEEVTNKYYSNC